MSIKMHSSAMGGALIRAPSTTLTNRTMQSPSGFTARLFGSTLGIEVFMVSRLFLTLHLGSVDILQQPTHTMPRQRMRPRRGSPWHPRRPRTSSSPSGSSTQALECLAAIDVFDTWWSSSAQPSPPPLASDHGRRSKTPCPNLPRENYAILHDLVFELRDGVNDLQFRVQQMEGRLTVLLQLLANPPEASPEDSSDASLSDHAGSHQQDDTEGSLQSAGKADTPVPLVDSASMPALVSNERGDEGPIAIAAENETSSRLQTPTSVASVKLEANEDKADDITDMQWTLSGGTPVIEEPWPGLLPEYKPDYTQLVPYSSSHGSHDS